MIRSNLFSYDTVVLGAGPESITTIVSMDSGLSPAGCPGMTTES